MPILITPEEYSNDDQIDANVKRLFSYEELNRYAVDLSRMDLLGYDHTVTNPAQNFYRDISHVNKFITKSQYFALTPEVRDIITYSDSQKFMWIFGCCTCHPKADFGEAFEQVKRLSGEKIRFFIDNHSVLRQIRFVGTTFLLDQNLDTLQLLCSRPNEMCSLAYKNHSFFRNIPRTLNLYGPGGLERVFFEECSKLEKR